MNTFYNTKKHLAILLILVLIFSTTAISNATDTTSASSSKLCLWEVSPKNDSSGKNIVYLLGSVHVGDDRLYPLDSRIEDTYNACNKLAVEIDLSKLSQQQVASSLLKHGLMKTRSLDKLLSTELYNKCDSIISKYTDGAQNLFMYSRFEPWVIDSLITNLAIDKTKYASKLGIDEYFINKANADKKSIIELETIDSQYEAISSQSLYVQKYFLEKNVSQVDSINENVNDLLTLWKKGYAEGIARVTLEDYYSNKYLVDYYNKLLFNRNVKMANTIDSYMKSGGKYFVVVGVGHLVGEKSIIDLLQADGYDIKQL